MNIEFINHPKAVIESFYGHSPGEVYTIPEEEDEICSPTGADGVTSLRKQRMASGWMAFLFSNERWGIDGYRLVRVFHFTFSYESDFFATPSFLGPFFE